MTDVFASLSRLSNWQSLLDVALVTLVFYGLFRLFRGTRAIQLVRGVLVFVIVFAILGQTIDLPAFNWLMRTASPMVLVALPVIFQPELRRALERVGRSAPLLMRRGDTSQTQTLIAEIVRSVEWMAQRRYGALLVFEGVTGLAEIVDSGVTINAEVTAELLTTVFFPNTPLHDGAVILRKERVLAAACVLPLTDRGLTDSQMGTRHRAAIGVTEQSDALVIVVSEETGRTSVARNGRIVRLDSNRLRTVLSDYYRTRNRVDKPMERLEAPAEIDLPAAPAAPTARLRPRIQAADIGTLLLSLVLALTVWLIAVNQENPLIVQELEARVPLTVVGLGEAMEVVQDLSTESVALKLRAPRTSWESMRQSDFTASLDLTGLGSGEHDVSVRVTRRDPQVTVLEVQRPEYTVVLDARIEKEIPVQVEIMDGAAFGYEWQAPIYTPITVTISGPQSQVDQVARARAEVYLRSAKSQVERTQTLTPVDAQGRAIERVTVTAPGRAQIVVPVEQWPGRKEVAVRVKLSGPPAAGYRLSAVRSEPSTVVLQGDPDVLSQVPGFVETEPLDLTDATADVRKRVALLLPEGVTSYDGDFVMASAGISPIEGGITVAEPLVVRGLGPGLTAAASLEEVNVILSGPMPLLESMNEDDVFAILDLSGLVPGTHTLKPSIVLPDGIREDGVIPETVEVVIKLQETAASNDLPQVPDVEATAAVITPTATLTVAPAAGMTIPGTLLPPRTVTPVVTPAGTQTGTPAP